LTEKGTAALPTDEGVRRAIRQAAEYALPLRASELSQITRERSRAWREGSEGEALNIYVDLIPDEEYEAGEARLERLEEALAEALAAGKVPEGKAG
jgi:hypothetical protein